MNKTGCWKYAGIPALFFSSRYPGAPLDENEEADILYRKIASGTGAPDEDGSLWSLLSPEDAKKLADGVFQKHRGSDPLFCYLGDGVYSAVFVPLGEDCLCLLHDVTHFYTENQKMMDEALLASQAKTSFLSEMSHDLRTPMNAIVGLTEIALMQPDIPPKIKECLDKLKVASGNMMGLLNDVLDMSRIESGKILLAPEEMDIADLLHELLVLVRPLADQKHLHFHIETGSIDNERFLADGVRVKQICMNFLSNAVKFTPEGGRVDLYIELAADGDHLNFLIRVKDTGIGMSRDFIRKVFQPFEREQSSSVSKIQGSGLGMAISKNLVELMGGRISVESVKGEGSTFTACIPVKPAEACEDIHRRALENKWILLLDDREERAAVTISMLEKLGMQVDWRRTEEEIVYAINETVFNDWDYFAFLTVDKAGDTDILTFISEIRTRMGRDFPILLLSENDWSQIEYMYTRAGVDAFIPIPLFSSRLSRSLCAFSSEAEDSIHDPGAAKTRDFSSRRILLVEDNELNREIAKELLADSGVSIESAVNGKQAVDMVEGSAPFYYDLILMDIQMPVMNGLDASRAIRKLKRPDAEKIPIIALTANAFLEDIKRSRDAGMNAHLAKPLDMEQMLSCMEEFMGREDL